MLFVMREEKDRACAELAMSLAGYSVGVAEADLRSQTRRGGDVAFARQVAMYLAHVALEMSLARVAVAFRRDRSTVAHACHVMEDRRDDARFDMWMAALEEAARAAPGPLQRNPQKRAEVQV
jgi:chromosomal replication initiation ATPase DnaA